jgi:ferrous iron transport protein A
MIYIQDRNANNPQWRVSGCAADTLEDAGPSGPGSNLDAVANNEVVSLSSLSKGEHATVLSVIEDGQSLGDEQASTIARRLLELGFVPGAELEVVARMWPGDDPVAVRVGGSMFALRRREAQAIRVRRGAAAAPTTDAGAR